MTFVHIIKMNLKIIKVTNSCDIKQFTKLFNEIFMMTDSEIEKIFTKKYFIWNILRGKDFYKTISRYVIKLLEEGEDIDENRPSYTERLQMAEHALHYAIITEPRDYVKRAFVKSILRRIPILTLDTVAYVSKERLNDILEDVNDNMVITDDTLLPFVEKIAELEKRAIILDSIDL